MRAFARWVLPRDAELRAHVGAGYRARAPVTRDQASTISTARDDAHSSRSSSVRLIASCMRPRGRAASHLVRAPPQPALDGLRRPAPALLRRGSDHSVPPLLSLVPHRHAGGLVRAPFRPDVRVRGLRVERVRTRSPKTRHGCHDRSPIHDHDELNLPILHRPRWCVACSCPAACDCSSLPLSAYSHPLGMRSLRPLAMGPGS